MAKIINKVADGYQIIPRELIFDSTISDRARFVYCFMASKPEGWDFFLEPMAKEVGYSKDTLRKYINELVDGGWLVRGEQANTNDLFGAVCYELQPTKFTDTEKYRHGKNPTQDNIDIIDNIDKHSMNVDKKEKEIDKSISKKTEKLDFLNAPDLCKSPNRIGQIAKSHNTDNNITDNKEYDKEKNFSLSKKWKVDFSIVPDNLTSVVEEWLAYKKERRETYKPKGFKVLVRDFVEYSQGDPNIAQRIIEQSMRCNYAGIFPLKDKANLSNYDTGMIIHGDRNELYEADKKNLW